MHSRAYMLLRRDLVNLQRFPLAGIVAVPTNDISPFHWSAKIDGLGETVWEGGIFRVTLRFNEEFNSKPPEVHFMTIPYHPNIDPSSGVPSCHLLTTSWTEDYTVSSVLLALQALLDNPELDGGCTLNAEAARLLRNAPHTYRQMVLDCVTASLRIDAGLPPYEVEEEEVREEERERPPSVRQMSRSRRRRAAIPISFDDYHTLWKGIATSLPSYQQTSPLVQLMDRDPLLYTVHCEGKSKEQLQSELEKKYEEHVLLKYGSYKPGGKQLPSTDMKARLQRIEDLKRMYREATDDKVKESSDPPKEEDEGKEEVEELVQWTKELDERELST